jgi:A/G-specific adenine glycosylase
VSPAAVSDRAAKMQSIVLDWYASNGRDLAFRRTTDPWAILVSEVMAQQTQAARAAEAWTRFMAQFPTPGALAVVSPATVIRAWRGLGYNRRPLALRAAAIATVEKHFGAVPDSLETLLDLPGIGPYTARAVLAIAFNRPVAALDVNIRRVLGRAFLDRHRPARELQDAADALVPVDHAAAWTHALMDIGAAFCRTQDPRCDACPLRTTCTYRFRSDATSSRSTSMSPAKYRPAIRFESTTRWLRGRILDRLRDAPPGEWTAFTGSMGIHDRGAVDASLGRLAAEGLIEVVDGQARLAP